MKVLSKAERENQYRKRADAATRKAASPNTDKRQATLRKIKERLQQLNYVINDEKALEEIIGDDNKLNLDKIGILSERGIISLNEKNWKPKRRRLNFLLTSIIRLLKTHTRILSLPDSRPCPKPRNCALLPKSKSSASVKNCPNFRNPEKDKRLPPGLPNQTNPIRGRKTTPPEPPAE